MQRIYWGRTNAINLWLSSESLRNFTAPTSIWVQLYNYDPQRSEVLGQTGGILGSPVTTGAAQSNGSYQITLPALTDPNPNTPDTYVTYWIGVRYVPTSGAQAQAHIQAIRAQRDLAFLDKLGITQTVVESYDRSVGSLFGSNSVVLSNLATLVEQEFRHYFKLKGIALEDISNWGDLQPAAVYKLLSLAHTSEIEVTGDGHDRKATLYKTLADNYLSTVSLTLTTDTVEVTAIQRNVRVYG